MTPRAIADRNEREAALDVSRSFIVQAPAGSGKTSLLVSRYLRILAAGAKPEEIVAITFTRKAAAEMRGRVTRELAPELAPRLRIQTIDALCAALTARMPVLSRFGAQPEVTEDATLLYREAAARALSLLAEKNISGKVEKLLSHLDNNVPMATELLADMLARRDQWLRATGVAPTRKELEPGLRFERGRLLNKARQLHPQASPAMAVAMLKKSDQKWKAKAPESLRSVPGLEAMLAALLILPPEEYSAAQWDALEAILGLLNPAVAQLLVVFSQRGLVDFTQVAHGALAALGSPEEPTDLALSLDAAVRHLLVDEFQDTSNSQWELLRRLTAGWQPEDGRTVFVVGDPMQSIYRFRDAQVGLFLRAWNEGLPGVKLEPLTLATNFRSQGAIVDWVNRVFPSVLPPAEDEASGAVPYSPSVPLKVAEPGGAPALELFARREDEAARVVELVRKARGRSAILVRNRSQLDQIVPALKDAGIRFRAVEIEQLGERQVVQDLFALTRALTHLGDRVAWLAILRAPWTGLDLSLLSSYFEGRSETIWELIQAVPSLERLRAVLAPALEHRLRGTLRDRVEGVWLALGGPACVEDATDLEDAAIFLDELERLEEAGELADFGALARSLGKLYALPDVAAGPEAVQIMTVHKAKGLEFDTVIVPGLDRPPQSSRRPLFAWRALPGGQLLLAPIDETGGAREPLFEYVRLLDREAEDIEAGRLFYVAATRAISRLHLLGCVKVNEHGLERPPHKRSLLGIAWDALGGSVHLPAPAPAAPGEDERLPPGELRRLASDFRMPPAPPAVRWTPPAQAREEQPPPFDWATETVRHAGIVVHAWLQRIAEDALRGWDAGRVDALRPKVVRDLERRGMPAAELERATGLVIAALRNALADERGRWLLGPHPMARSEHRIRTPGRTLRIDRCFRDAAGTLWVVDYKTGEHRGDIERYLDEQQKRYAPQLDAYSQAMQGARRGLYFPLLKGWREW